MVQWNTDTSKAIWQLCDVNFIVKVMTINVYLLWKTIESQNHRMFQVGRDFCGWTSPTPLPKQGHLQQAAQDLVQAGLEYLQRRRLHNLPGQPVPVLRQPVPVLCQAYKLSWIDVSSTNISGCLCLSRPKMVFRAMAWFTGYVSLTFFSLLPLTAAVQHFLPFLKYDTTEVPPAQLMGPALGSSGSILELAGPGSLRHGTAPVSSCKGHPCSTPRYQNVAA